MQASCSALAFTVHGSALLIASHVQEEPSLEAKPSSRAAESPAIGTAGSHAGMLGPEACLAAAGSPALHPLTMGEQDLGPGPAFRVC